MAPIKVESKNARRPSGVTELHMREDARAAKIFHITTEVELTEARRRGEYRPAAFDREQFVHCSYLSQVAATATRIFRGRTELVLLEIDSVQLHCDVVDENLEGGTERFPHVYGPIPLTAITRVHALPCADDGTFTLPRTLAG